jgi:membrane protease YdiL (CAAX protease family)
LKAFSILGIIPLLVTVILIPTFARFANSGSSPLHHPYLSFQLKYQSLLLLSTIISVGALALLSRNNFVSLFGFGNISAEASAVQWLGIKDGEKWSGIGRNMLFVISLVTATFLFFQFKGKPLSWSLVLNNLHWILLFSFLNAFSEEMIFRFGIATSLKGSMPIAAIVIVSAISFGAVHFGGTPGGFIGIGLASTMGFILCKALFETQGMFWPIAIHFVQDILIISSILLSYNKSFPNQ